MPHALLTLAYSARETARGCVSFWIPT